MGGPSVSRSDVNTAPLPGLTPQYESLLKGLLGSMGGQFGQTSALQGQVGNAFANQLRQPTAQQRTFESALPQLLGLLGNYQDVAKQSSPQGVLDAYQPLFQRNLQLGADILRQGGPRLNSNTERLVGQQNERSLQDYNLFAQQAIQSATQNRLGALGGATNTLGMLGNLGQGADTSLLALLSGAGGFGNQQQANQLGLLNLFGQNATGPAALVQNPGWFQTLTQLAGGLGMGAAGLGWQPFGKGK